MPVRSRNKRDTLIVVDAGFKTSKVFAQLFSNACLFRSLSQIDEFSVVCFEGGTDINPAYYKSNPCSWTQSPDTGRDQMEANIFRRAQAVGAGVLGICRGAQLACALSGGSLIQHVTGHDNGAHSMFVTNTTAQGKWSDQVIPTTSAHHQMMYPFDMELSEFRLLAYADKPRSQCYWESKEETLRIPPVEPEVVWFPKTHSLAIQGHPEWADQTGPYVEYCRDIVRQFLIPNPLQGCNQ